MVDVQPIEPADQEGVWDGIHVLHRGVKFDVAGIGEPVGEGILLVGEQQGEFAVEAGFGVLGFEVGDFLRDGERLADLALALEAQRHQLPSGLGIVAFFGKLLVLLIEIGTRAATAARRCRAASALGGALESACAVISPAGPATRSCTFMNSVRKGPRFFRGFFRCAFRRRRRRR